MYPVEPSYCSPRERKINNKKIRHTNSNNKRGYKRKEWGGNNNNKGKKTKREHVTKELFDAQQVGPAPSPQNNPSLDLADAAFKSRRTSGNHAQRSVGTFRGAKMGTVSQDDVMTHFKKEFVWASGREVIAGENVCAVRRRPWTWRAVCIGNFKSNGKCFVVKWLPKVISVFLLPLFLSLLLASK